MEHPSTILVHRLIYKTSKFSQLRAVKSKSPVFSLSGNVNKKIPGFPCAMASVSLL